MSQSNLSQSHTHSADCQGGSGNCSARAAQPGDFDFDVSRAFTLLTAMLIIPMFLALTVVQFSMGALLL